jgi:putative ABC transport system permease protein
MRLYRTLLRVYPRAFRSEYGREMEEIFRTRRLEASGLGVVTLWIEALADVVTNAIRVHLDHLRVDLVAAFRALHHARGFAVTAILVAALGTGAALTTFSVADHVLVRPLPFPQSDHLVMAWQDQSARGYSRMELSVGNYMDWKARSRSFDGFAAFTSNPVNLVGHGSPERLDATFVTPDVFATLGVQAAAGRSLVAADGNPQDTTAVVLSDSVWRTKFGGEQIVGREINLDGMRHVVVGIMPPHFQFPTRETDLWLPFLLRPDDDRSNVYLRTVARLRPGVTLDQARGELRVIAAQLEQEYPDANAQTSATVHLLRDQVTGQQRTLLVTLVSAAICLLLIACLNLANLLLARSLVRQRELAVRTAMGASGERLMRQLLVESFVIAVAGGAIGVALAYIATPLVARLVPTTMPIPDAPSLDLRMLLIAGALTCGTALIFGAIPALRAMRQASASGLRDNHRTGSSRHTERLRGGLVIAEIAATVALLVASGLLARATWNVMSIDPGFRAEGVLTARTTLPFPAYAATARRQQFYDHVLDGVRAIPGVTNAAYTSFLPMVMRGGIWAVTFNTPKDPPAGAVSLRLVTPGYFATMGIPIIAGRDIAVSDTMESPLVAVVSASFVRRHWSGQDPIGRRVFIGPFERTVVGVAGDVRVRGLERESEPQLYVASRQVPDGALAFYAPKDLVVRSTVPPTTLVPALREIVARADPNQPLSDVQLMSDILTADTAGRRTQLYVVIGFAVSAFLLAAIGIHGLLAFSVASRTRDIGVRIALGARPESILAMVLRKGLRLATLGIAIGLVLAFATGRLLQSLLVGVAPGDAGILVAAAALVLVMTLVGSFVPARRATGIDPIAAMRTE